MRVLFMLLFGATLLSFAQTTTDIDVHAIGILFDGDGLPLTAGKIAYYAVPYTCTISGWDMTVDSGSAVVDVLKVGPGGELPQITNSITGANPPAVFTGQHVHSANLTGWHRSVYPHHVFGFYLKQANKATQASLVLQCQ